MYTKGTILELEPGQLLKHNLFSGDNHSVISVITYTLIGNGETTTLFAREDLSYEPSDKEYEEASEGWDSALLGVKKQQKKYRERCLLSAILFCIGSPGINKNAGILFLQRFSSRPTFIHRSTRRFFSFMAPISIYK
jgi:hypothetical protein